MQALRRLSLGIALLLAASAVLLLPDSGRRRGPGERRALRVALVQHASQPIMEEGVRGMLAGLAAGGWREGANLSVRRYNAEGDIATANTIASEVVQGGYDLLLTVTTPSLQTVANANRAGAHRHVFALVTDPVAAGVGISGPAPAQHPPWLVGYGTLQPVRAAFELARELLPSLRRVGVVWNAAEANSEAQMRIARQVCGELGIELVEANAENSAAVLEAAASVTAREVQAVWVPGDVTVLTAVDSVIAAARRAGVPVFTSIPGNVDRGALFDLGANYTEVGRVAGALAARVLAGEDPAAIGVENVMPERLLLNPAALEGLRDPWRIPPEVAVRAAAEAPTPAPAPLARLWNLHLIEYVHLFDVAEAENGIRVGLKEAGLVEGRDFRLSVRNAQADMPTLSALVDAAVSDGADMLLTLSTPTLQAAMQRGGSLPIVFTFVADGVAAGAGRSNTDHRANVTGVPSSAAIEEMLELIRGALPRARRLGTLFAPAESNSEYYRAQFERLAPGRGFELVSVPVNSTAEASDATLSLLAQGIDAVVQIPGNLTSSAFASIAQPAARAGLPVFGFLSSDFDNGAVVVIARDYFDGGREAAAMAARIMRGESPSAIPFEPLKTAKVMVNLDAARALKLELPAAIVQGAAKVVGGGAPAGGPR